MPSVSYPTAREPPDGRPSLARSALWLRTRSPVFFDSCFAMLANIPTMPSPIGVEVSMLSCTQTSGRPSSASSSGASPRTPLRESRSYFQATTAS